MSLDKDLINKLVSVTSKAAINCYQFLGKGNKKITDKAATDSMRNDLNNLEINGEVVIGEGELDEAPMLYIGEKLGNGNGHYHFLVFLLYITLELHQVHPHLSLLHRLFLDYLNHFSLSLLPLYQLFFYFLCLEIDNN